MARSDKASIQFPCPQCFSRLKASPSQAGTRHRCPQCQWMFEVPAESRALEPEEGYAVGEGTEGLPPADRPCVAVVCAVCSTRMYAGEDEVGREVTCPDCGTLAVVRRPPEAAAAAGQGGAAPVPAEGYALSEEIDRTGSSGGRRAAEMAYFPVDCPVCDTMMKVSEDQVGQEIVCPDCQRSMTVPAPPPPKPKADRWAHGVGGYAIRDEAGAESDRPLLIPVVCPQCDTRLHAPVDQVGRELFCPDCDRSIVVPQPQPTKRKAQPAAEHAEGYAVVEPDEAGEARDWQPTMIGLSRRVGPSAAGTDDDAALIPPRWPFFSGVFHFPVYGQSWYRWLGMSVGGAIILAMVINSAGLSSEGKANSIFAAMMFFAFACVLTMLWTVVTSASMLAILIDTAYGHDEVESWPSGPFLDWMLESLFVVHALLLSAAPMLVTAYFAGSADLLRGVHFPIIIMVLFPIILLSMLETGSPVNLVSPTTWRTLWVAWWAWGLFYVETTLLLAGLGRLAQLAWSLGGLPAAALTSTILVAMLMIYVRLLGRLAYCCSKALARVERPIGGPTPGEQEDGEKES